VENLKINTEMIRNDLKKYIYLNDFRWTLQSDILKPLLQQVGLLAAVRVVPSQHSGKAAACVLCSTLRCMR
jgi:hypothetical protein